MRNSAIIAAVLIAACTDRNPVAPVEEAPSASISDAVHESGNAHFFFLPPVVSTPATHGVFDDSLSPLVQICEWTTSGCATPLVAEFTSASGPGSERVRLSVTDQLYIVNWNTDEFALNPGKAYRIRVLVVETELGHADIAIVASGKEIKNIETGQFVPLVAGRTLPIKFRIERGAVFVVGSGGGSVVAAEGVVRFDIPEGATTGLGITVVPSETPSGVGLVPGTVFDLGPEGTTFTAPVNLTIAYEESALPAGIDEASLTLLTEHDGRWDEIPGAAVDAATNTVSGLIPGFSRKGVGGKVGSIEVTPATASLSVCATQQLSAVVKAADGTPMTGRNVNWSSSDNAIAVVDRNGVVRGVTAGAAFIEAASGGQVATSTITVVASPGVTSCTNVVEIDATMLSASVFDVSGTGQFSSSILTALSLIPGDYALTAAQGYVRFTITQTGSVDFGVDLDGVLAGRGTRRLTLVGTPITIDATALSAAQAFVSYLPMFPTSEPKVLRLLPTLDPNHPYGLSAAQGTVAFLITNDGLIDFDPSFDGVLSGRGTGTLVAHGAAITIDATSLSAPEAFVSYLPLFPTSTPRVLRLLPTLDADHSYGFSAAQGIIGFQVSPAGLVDYDPSYDGVLSGRGTATLIAQGAPITLDATTLSAMEAFISYLPAFSTSSPKAFWLLPTLDADHPYGFSAAQGVIGFQVSHNGLVDYDPTYDGVLTGRGTTTLGALGAPITIDATALSAPEAFVSYLPLFPTSALKAFRLLPTLDAEHPYGLTAAQGVIGFLVTREGLVDFDASYDAVLGGRGTATLVVQGAPITIDATALSAPEAYLSYLPPFATVSAKPFRLLPTADADHTYGLTAAQGVIGFLVTRAGLVDYDASYNAVLGGRGTSTLVAQGAPIVIDATALGDMEANLVYMPAFSTTSPVTRRVLPNLDAEHATGFSSSVFNFVFVVTKTGTIDYDVSLNQSLAGRGTTTLTILNADPDGDGINNDADACPSNSGPTSNAGCPVPARLAIAPTTAEVRVDRSTALSVIGYDASGAEIPVNGGGVQWSRRTIAAKNCADCMVIGISSTHGRTIVVTGNITGRGIVIMSDGIRSDTAEIHVQDVIFEGTILVRRATSETVEFQQCTGYRWVLNANPATNDGWSTGNADQPDPVGACTSGPLLAPGAISTAPTSVELEYTFGVTLTDTQSCGGRLLLPAEGIHAVCRMPEPGVSVTYTIDLARTQ
jgi:hypothetical protein